MLDNLGFGEIFFLGLLLFLFLGPERLPQLGARLGRWVSNLTRYSGAFMNEWREEALAVHDAMEQVRGMRDEIAAARAEIAGTLYEARDDLGEAVEGARQDVGQQVQRATRFEVGEPAGVPAEGEPAPSAKRSEEAVIAKTQQVVDDLLAKRAESGKPVRAAPARLLPGGSLREHGVPAVRLGAPGSSPAYATLPPDGDPRERGVPTLPAAQEPVVGPSAADVARLRDQVHDLGAEVEVLRAAVAEVREALEERVVARALAGR